MLRGTVLNGVVSRVVDGDTLRVFLEGAEKDESLRILALDTEESYAGGSKPVTPWGKKAKERAESIFKAGDQVQLEFPGNETIEVCMKKYRGNYGRLLVFVHKDAMDYQELMIKEGFSPYFCKYGNAEFRHLHDRYIEAERFAQANHLGVWNQLEVNGSDVRNYSALSTWWSLRAEIIDNYRREKNAYDHLYNSRLDYEAIKELAASGQHMTVFTELRDLMRIGQNSAVIRIGSIEQPFSLFLPTIESEEGQKIIQLLEARYIPSDDLHPKRSYAFVKGNLSLYNESPQIVLRSASQITDDLHVILA